MSQDWEGRCVWGSLRCPDARLLCQSVGGHQERDSGSSLPATPILPSGSAEASPPPPGHTSPRGGGRGSARPSLVLRRLTRDVSASKHPDSPLSAHLVYRPSPHSQNLCSSRAGGECLAHCRGVCRLRKHTNEQPIARGLRGGRGSAGPGDPSGGAVRPGPAEFTGWCSASEPSARVHPGQPCHLASPATLLCSFGRTGTLSCRAGQ